MTTRARTPQSNGGEGSPIDYYAPTSEFAQRPPSPPFIHIPSRNQDTDRVQLVAPSEFDGVDMGDLSPQELDLITGSGKLQRGFVTEQWHYELRRHAQPILDFVYLGPSSVARNVEFLEEQGITMVLGARDARLAAVRLNKIEQECNRIGVRVEYIDVGSPGALIKSFSDATKIINQHLVQVYRAQMEQQQHLEGTDHTATIAERGRDVDADTSMDVDSATSHPAKSMQPGAGTEDPNFIRRGKVLVFCETGNDRSAAVVAAYIMAVFRVDMVTAIQFVQGSRFCSCFDEETKQMLLTYEDLLQAKRQIASSSSSAPAARLGVTTTGGGAALSIASSQHEVMMQEDDGTPAGGPEAGASTSKRCYPPRQAEGEPPQLHQSHHKRGHGETMDDEDRALLDMNGTGDMDRERYLGRNFAPFIDNRPP